MKDSLLQENTQINCNILPIIRVGNNWKLRKMFKRNFEETFYMRGKLKELRESRHLTQTGMGARIGVTQQNISRYEKDVSTMPVEMLLETADYFNVTTDYLLGRSEMKRNLEGQVQVNKEIDEYFDLVEMYRDLDARDREIVLSTITAMIKTKAKKE